MSALPVDGDDFAYFRWHCHRYPERKGGFSCEGYTAWQCHRLWKSGNRG